MNFRFVIAIALPFLALGLQTLLWPWISPFVWFLFFPAVFFSARIGALWGGLCSTVLCAGMVWYYFIPQRFSWVVESPSNLYSVGLFLVMGYLFSDTQERLRKAQGATETALLEARVAGDKISQLYQKTLELDELKNQFFANISHELRTPLTLIMSPLIRRLANEDIAAPQRREDEMILRNARLLYRHVCDLLDAAKLEAGQMSVEYAHHELGALLRTTAILFEPLAQDKDIDYRIEIEEATTIEADGEKLQRILLNLLSNAFKFTPDGGSITLRSFQSGDWVEIELTDNGPGVPEHLRAAVFDRFRQVEGGSQRRFSGTGLGLAIVKEFAELHGGAVTVDDAPGGGARFVVRLPLRAPTGTRFINTPSHLDALIEQQAVEELVRPQPPTNPEPASADAPLVLVVEDNPDMNAFIADTLRPYYRVAAAYDGQQALHQARMLRPALILSDIMMPNMSGDQLVKCLRRQPEMADVPIVILSAKADNQLRVDLLKLGVQDYLNKPFVPEELLARVEGLLATRRRTAENLSRNAARLYRLVEIIKKLTATNDLTRQTAIICHTLREITKADGTALILREGDFCHYVDEDAMSPLWKGQRFPLNACIAGWTILEGQNAIIQDINTDPRIAQAVYQPTFVKSLSMVAIGQPPAIGALGCYWRYPNNASLEDLQVQETLADIMSLVLRPNPDAACRTLA